MDAKVATLFCLVWVSAAGFKPIPRVSLCCSLSHNIRAAAFAAA
jgi:hypothetical protein